MWSVLQMYDDDILCVVDFGDNFIYQKRAHWTGGADDVVELASSVLQMYVFMCVVDPSPKTSSLMWSNVHRLSCRCNVLPHRLAGHRRTVYM